ncbi:Unknown protein [Striga hermonthica]|uniref:Uncharacterized protein n=1 Tax=Striga hermonthica TaxID=68872 RepID=A0A9N7NCC5_STRHE|nr:Unknown protein [Striga hermonthica]
MASNAKILANEEFETKVSRRFQTPLFSSSFSDHQDSLSSSPSSSSFSYMEDYPTFSPTPPLEFKGNIPFSWEKIPGIPKHQSESNKKEYSEHLLPPPPTGISNSSGKKSIHREENFPKKSNRFENDPFFAALVECSKDGNHDSSKNITRSLSDRLCFMNYTSCIRACAASEPIVCTRSRPSPHYLLSRRSS